MGIVLAVMNAAIYAFVAAMILANLFLMIGRLKDKIQGK